MDTKKGVARALDAMKSRTEERTDDVENGPRGKLVACVATIDAKLPRWKNDGTEYAIDAKLDCCLMSPHEQFKHLNPRLQLTLGGAHVVVESWSPWIDRLDVVRCGECGARLSPEIRENENVEPITHRKWCESSIVVAK